MVIGVRLSGGVILREVVISIGNAVLKANNSNTLSEFGCHITFADDWARSILQSMDWVKRNGISGKIEPPSPQFLAEERYTF